MKKKYKRRKYFIHPLSQGPYIAFSIVPALFMTLFCTYFLIHSGQLVLIKAKEKPLALFYSFRQTILTMEKEGYTKETEPRISKRISKLKNELSTLKNTLETSYYETVTQWNKIRQEIFFMLLLFLFIIGIMALLYSHRIAGPLFRINKCINILSEGKDPGSISLRRHDSFKELAASLEKLRINLKDKGLLD